MLILDTTFIHSTKSLGKLRRVRLTPRVPLFDPDFYPAVDIKRETPQLSGESKSWPLPTCFFFVFFSQSQNGLMARNESKRPRYILVLRFWHPGLSEDGLGC